MITGFGLHNYRAFQDSKLLALPPVTCLAGPNSSGKSTFINALLLLKQSAEEGAFGSPVPLLRLNGTTFEGGTYADVVFERDEHRSVGFTFRHVPRDPEERRIPRRALVTFAIPTTIRMTRFRQYWPPELDLPKGLSTDVTIQFSPEEPFGPTLSKIHIEVRNIGVATFTRTTGKQLRQHWRLYVSELPSKALRPIFGRGEILPFIRSRESAYRKVGPHIKRRINQFVTAANFAFEAIARFLERMRFLGPFRTPPSRRYVFSGFGGLDLGPSGEEAIDILIMERLLQPPDEQHLRIAVGYWLKHLGLASSLQVRDLAKHSNLFEVVLSNAGYATRANFADVGFGISQVLPVLVQGLLTPAGGTFVVQQPELHLHPDAQAELADFFLYLASRGIRSIVETHSEYFLLRLRRRLAERYQPPEIGIRNEKVIERIQIGTESINVVAVEAGPAESVVLPLALDESFQFSNMPRGFMNQALEERRKLISALGAAQ
jgi:predicted ATPase